MQKLSLTAKSNHGEGVDDAMRGLSAVFVDGDNVFIDNGAIHAKSRLERGLTFVKNKEDVPQPRPVWGFWVTLHRFDGGVQGYYGLMPFVLQLDESAGVAWKSLAQQVNHMERAVKGQVQLDDVPAEVVERLSTFLQTLRPELWENAASAFRDATTK